MRPLYAVTALGLLEMMLAGCGDSARHPLDLDFVPIADAGEDALPSGPATACSPTGEAKLLSNLPGHHRLPRLGYTATGFVVAWNTELDLQMTPRNRIDGTLTDRDGNRLGPNLSLSADPIADPGAPSVTPLVGGIVLAWTRVTAVTGGFQSDIFLSALDATGQRLDGNGLPCDPADFTCGQFQVTSSGAASQPELARPQVDGTTARPTDHQVSLAYIDERNYACGTPPCVQFNDVYWKKLQGNGTVLIEDKRITMAGASQTNSLPRLAFDGVHEGLVWRTAGSGNSATFSFTALDGAGLVSGQPVALGTAVGALASSGAGDLVWDAKDYGLVTATGSDSLSSVVFQRFSSNGLSALPPVGVTFGGVACTPAVSWDGEFFAVVWQTACGQPGSNIAFELLDSHGVRLRSDGSSCGNTVDPMCGVVFLTHNTSVLGTSPSIVWAGGHSFGVAWTSATANPVDPSQIVFQRVDCVSP